MIPHLIQQIPPIGLQYLLFAGLLSVFMSTGDSYLHAAGVSLPHDLIQLLSKKLLNESRWLQYAALGIGVISIIIGLSHQHIFSLGLNALQAISPLLIFPLIANIVGIKANHPMFFMAAGVTCLTFAVARRYLSASENHLAALWSLFAHGISFLRRHCLFNNQQYPTH